VYDVGDKSSFKHLDYWRNEFFTQSGIEDSSNYPLVILGNKIDRKENRVVKREAAEEWCTEHNCLYFETSAKQSVNVETAFLSTVRQGLGRLPQEPIAIDVVDSSTQEKGCCG